MDFYCYECDEFYDKSDPAVDECIVYIPVSKDKVEAFIGIYCGYCDELLVEVRKPKCLNNSL